MTAAKLNHRQRRFVDEYVVDPNATQAAIRAGYSARTARQMGAENLSKPVIAEAVEEARRELAERAGIERGQIIEELKRLARSDIRDSAFWDKTDMTLRNSDDLPPDAARAIREVTETITRTEDATTVRRSVKLHDKLGALRDLAKILGMYPKEPQAAGTINQYNFDLSGVPTDELRSIRRLIDGATVPPT